VPILVAARSKAWVRSRGLLGLRVRIPPGTWMSVVSAVCCQFEVSAVSRSLVQRTPTECGVPECDLETSTMRIPLGLSSLGNIYVCVCFFWGGGLWRCDPTRVMASSFLRFVDHEQRRTTVGRTPLDE
jgi:hypothetical protein